MADRVHARVQAMEASLPQAPLDRILSKPKRAELPPPHHPVLSLGKLGNATVTRASPF